MEDKTARIRVNFSIGEIEIEGTEAFVREYVDEFEDLFECWRKQPKFGPAPQETAVTEQSPPSAKADMPETFGEYLHKYPGSITDTDRVLIAAHFIQCQVPEQCFTAREANELLTEQGIKVANVSSYVARLRKAKRVFVVSKEGKGKNRVSSSGIDYINQLLET